MRILYPKNIPTAIRHENAPYHSHLLWEVVFFIKGECKNYINDNVFNFYPGDVIILGPPHSHKIEGLDTYHCHRDLYFNDNTFHSICDQFYPELYAELCNNFPIIKIPSNVFQCIVQQLFLIETYENKLQSLDYKQSNKFNNFSPIFNSFLSYLLASHLFNTIVNENETPTWLLPILNKLNDPSFFTLKPIEIIKESGYSHSRFSEIFKYCTGVSLQDYIITKRLDYATELLITTNLSTLDISLTCGYDSYSCFSNLFKKKYSLSPLEYRKRYTKNSY